MEVLERIRILKSKLDAARSQRPFGVEAHEFRLDPPVSHEELERFEAQHSVRLPNEYRSFVTEVGAGGAGPAYGLIRFGDTLSYERGTPPEGFLRSPFPFDAATVPDEGPNDEGVAEADRRLLDQTRGTLVLCHEGSGYLHLLVCSGPQRDQMWLDGMVSEQGYAPLGVGFFDWYERWLDDVLGGGSGTWWLGSSAAESR